MQIKTIVKSKILPNFFKALDRNRFSKNTVSISGEVAEWSKAAVLKTVVAIPPWVRILPSPDI
jgi:hypothetical protein